MPRTTTLSGTLAYSALPSRRQFGLACVAGLCSAVRGTSGDQGSDRDGDLFETRYYRGLNLARAASDEWGADASLRRVGDHLYDWRANTGGTTKSLSLTQAVASQFGKDWDLVSVGVHCYDWRSVRFGGLPPAVLPVMLIASDQVAEIENVREGLGCFKSALAAVAAWYEGQVGRRFRVLQPLVVRSGRTAQEWREITRAARQEATRHVLLKACLIEYNQALPDPGDRLRVLLAPYSSPVPAPCVGGAGFHKVFAVVPTCATSHRFTGSRPDRRQREVMRAVAYELALTFGLRPDDGAGASGKLMAGAEPPDATLDPGEVRRLRQSPLFARGGS